MNLTLELPDEKLATWRSQAAAAGMTVETWLQSIADRHVHETATEVDDRPIWEIIASRAAGLPEEALSQQPPDGASEHDHYLYGHAKRGK